MEAAIGGRHTVTEVTTTRTRRHTVARITATVITTARLITITTPEPMDGTGVLMARTDLRIGAQVIILIQARTPEAGLSRPLFAPERQDKRKIHKTAPPPQRGKVQAPNLNGAVRKVSQENRGQTRAITRRPMEQWLAPRLRREEKRLPPVRSGETALSVKLQAAICMLDTMVTFIRTRVTAGKSTTTVVGTR